MDATLKLVTSSLAFGDPNTSNNPTKRFVDWTDSQTVSVKNPKSNPYTVGVGESLTLFSGTRSISADSNTTWAISLSSLASDRYRFSYVPGESAAPGLRTDRNVNIGGDSAAMVVNANQTVTLTAGAAVFGDVVAGDVVFIPGVSTGDTAGPFDTLNEGYWTVLAVTSTSQLQLGRPAGSAFSGKTETVTVADNTQFMAYSAAGVQVGDGVDISAGFTLPVLNSYQVVAVTPNWFEVISTSALPISAQATPGTSGIQFFSAAKRYVEVHADQNCVLQINGCTGYANKVTPWQAGDPEQMGPYIKGGLCWSLVVVNMSAAPLNIQLVTAE